MLLISSGDIKLEGYDYGFIGGASGKISDNTVVFSEMLKCIHAILLSKNYVLKIKLKLKYYAKICHSQMWAA